MAQEIINRFSLTHTHAHTEAPKKDFLHKPLGSIVRSKAAGLKQVGHATHPAQDPTYWAALGPWEEQRGATQALCNISTCHLGTFPLASAGKDRESPSTNIKY